MEIKANISISRDSSNKMRLRVQDETSRATFLEMEFSMADFMQALTGLAYTDAAKAEVFALDVVGKQKVTEARSVVFPGVSYDRNEMSAWLKQNCQEEGWRLDSYLGSQSSIYQRDGKTVLNYHVYRYVSLDADQSA